jgi:hypothetical protein
MLHALMPFALGSVEIVVLWAGIALAVAMVGGARRRWWAQRERSRLLYECHASERFIRDARQQAIHELLEAERFYRDRCAGGDVIEGTAVEVDR